MYGIALIYDVVGFGPRASDNNVFTATAGKITQLVPLDL